MQTAVKYGYWYCFKGINDVYLPQKITKTRTRVNLQQQSYNRLLQRPNSQYIISPNPFNQAQSKTPFLLQLQNCNQLSNSCNNMNLNQQKQHESEGEFQTQHLELETYQQPPALDYNHTHKHHPRNKIYSEKQRLGLINHPIVTQPQNNSYYSKPSKPPRGKIIKIGSATFRSNFESGSIGSVDLVGANSYQIMLDQETNSTRSNIWFYFAVEGVKGEANFTIKGFSKKSSLYNEGMKLCYRDSKQSNKWRRGGLKIRYQPYTVGEDQERFYCLKFSYFFKSNQFSSVDFAYSFPYGLNKLNFLISSIQAKVKVQSLGQSFQGRNIPVITLGNPKSKELIMVSARVHPGQTGSSFIVQGLLKQLIGDSQYANYLKEHFLIKVIPMINVDGVARGNYRFSASGADLNRKWKQPHQLYHPEIYLLKEMILRQNSERKIRMYIDLHGHSRKKNVFFYGCCPTQEPNNFGKAKAFPFLMSKLNNSFHYESCSFNIQRDKQGTARVTLFRELKIYQIFTLQASFCGLDNGPNFLESDYEKIGRKLCEGISLYFVQPNSSNIKSFQKLHNLREEALNQLRNSAYFLNVGNEEDSGSDSQPDKGQNKQKMSKCLKQKQDIKKQVKKSVQKSLSRNFYSQKQKSEATVNNFKQFKETQTYMYLFEPPTQTLDADFSKPTSNKNQRVHSISKQTRPTAKMFNLQEELAYNEPNFQKEIEKTKINLLVGREGAQYRRVRKIAEQSSKLEKSETNIFSVKGVKGSKIEMDNPLKVMPKLCLQQSKHRRTSAQMFFRKPARTQVGLQRSDMKVLCRGRQIFF